MSEFGEKIQSGEMPMYMTTAGMPVGPTLNEHLQRKINDAYFIEEDGILTTRAILKRFKAARSQPSFISPYGRDIMILQYPWNIEPSVREIDS